MRCISLGTKIHEGEGMVQCFYPRISPKHQIWIESENAETIDDLITNIYPVSNKGGGVYHKVTVNNFSKRGYLTKFRPYNPNVSTRLPGSESNQVETKNCTTTTLLLCVSQL